MVQHDMCTVRFDSILADTVRHRDKAAIRYRILFVTNFQDQSMQLVGLPKRRWTSNIDNLDKELWWTRTQWMVLSPSKYGRHEVAG